MRTAYEENAENEETEENKKMLDIYISKNSRISDRAGSKLMKNSHKN